MLPFNPLLFSSQIAALTRRRSPFQTILGVIPIPGVLVPPTVQTEAYLESLYFESIYTGLPTYQEAVYNETIYDEPMYGAIEPTV